jgi:hypothetical protein
MIRENIKLFPLSLYLFLACLLGCATGREVTSQIDTRKYPVVEEPIEFQSPIRATKGFLEFTEVKDLELLRIRKLAITELISQQEDIAKELKTSGKLKLKPGFSYEFTLESFCINAGIERPVVGDGLFLGDLKGSAKSWLPKILSDYKKRELSQNEAQVLIWSLLSGSRFNEMSSENQRNLMRIFPDAPVRFGHSLVEDSAQNFLLSQVPNQILEAKQKYDYYRNLLQDNQSRFSEIERALSPEPQRKSAIPVGWIRHEKGYFIRLKSDGYQRVQVQIYSPESIKPETYFDPSAHVALPGEGQRLSLSNYVLETYDQELQKYAKDKTGISTSEAKFILKYPIDAYKIYQASRKASDLTWKHQKSSNDFRDDRADAFRHFVWSALTTKEVGASKAREYLTAHEDFPGNDSKAKAMDLFNNEQGIDYGRNHKGDFFEEDLIQEAKRKIRENELRWIK